MHKYDPTKVGVVRYKSHGHRFELVCSRSEYAALIEKIHTGKASLPLESDQMKRVILSSTVFSNAHKWEASSKNTRADAFGDPEASNHMYSSILLKGEMMKSEQERNERHTRQQEMDALVCDQVRFMLCNIFTGVEPEVDDTNQILQTIRKASRIKIGTHAPSIVQAGVLASMIADKMECRRVASKLIVQHPSTYSGKWDVFLHDFSPVALSMLRTVSKEGSVIEQVMLVDTLLLKDADWLALVAKTDAAVQVEEASKEEIQLFSKQQYDMPSHSEAPNASAHVAPLIKNIKVKVEEPADESSEAKWNATTHKVLQQECKKRGLSTGGSKAVLIDRIVSHDE